MGSTLDSFNRLAQQLTEHPHLAELYIAVSTTSSLSKASIRARFSGLMHQMFRNVEDVYPQHLEGHLG
jgi:hypothetical protein